MRTNLRAQMAGGSDRLRRKHSPEAASGGPATEADREDPGQAGHATPGRKRPGQQGAGYERLTDATAFTVDAAHALKTQVAALRARLSGMGQIEGRELLERDLDSMERAVRQLLVSAAARTRSVARFEAVSLETVAVEVLAALAPLAVDRSVEIELDEPDAPVMVMADARLAAEALCNLVQNAIAHTMQGSTVTVRMRRPAVIEVLDRGPGIAPGEEARIFKPFTQGSRPTPGGSGMGLAIARQVMERHNGRISVRNREDGKGAAFRLDFVPLPLDATAGSGLAGVTRAVG